jgi:hypothetical protein
MDNQGSGRKRMSKSSGNENMKENMNYVLFLNVFLMSPIPTVLRCSFLFLWPVKLVLVKKTVYTHI